MPEREGQIPPIIQATQETAQYAEKKVFEGSPFKKAVNAIIGKLGTENPQAQEAAQNMVKQGVEMAISRIRLLPAFSNPDSRKEILDKLKQDKAQGAWVDILANWDVSADPYGVSVLTKCKVKDIQEINFKAKNTKTAQEEEQVKLQAQAIAKGQDIIIDYYRKQISSTEIRKAA